MAFKRYIVTCPHCGAKNGTNPVGMDPPNTEPTEQVDCVQCGFKVSRRGGQYIRAIAQKPEKEFDLLALE